MILIDTSVLVDYLRSPTDQTLRLFEKHSVVICGVTRAEILAGARKPGDVDRIAASLDAIEQIAIAEKFWDLLGKNLSVLRAAGITVPFADAMIATLAIENDLALWTRDSHFTLIKNVMSELRLFQLESPS